MTANDYLIAWGLYALAAVGCFLVWMRLTRWMWRWLRQPLRLVGAVLLFSPTLIDPAKELYAPAIAVIALDIVFKVVSNALHAMSEVAMYCALVLGLYVLYALIRWPLETSARSRREADALRQEAADKERLREEKARADREPLGAESFSAQAADRLGKRPPPPPVGGRRVEPRL